MRDKIREDSLRAFENTSYLAQQIVIDKPDHWEYKLTAEILRSDLESIQRKWNELQNGLYLRKSTYVQREETLHWLTVKLDDSRKIAAALERLISVEMNKAWGTDGVPGDPHSILRTCRLIAAAAENFLEWEEDMRFTHFPEEFEEAIAFLQGAAGKQIEELMRIPSELAKIFENRRPTGIHKINLVFRLTEDFGEQFGRVLQRSQARYLDRIADATIT